MTFHEMLSQKRIGDKEEEEVSSTKYIVVRCIQQAFYVLVDVSQASSISMSYLFRWTPTCINTFFLQGDVTD